MICFRLQYRIPSNTFFSLGNDAEGASLDRGVDMLGLVFEDDVPDRDPDVASFYNDLDSPGHLSAVTTIFDV